MMTNRIARLRAMFAAMRARGELDTPGPHRFKRSLAQRHKNRKFARAIFKVMNRPDIAAKVRARAATMSPYDRLRTATFHEKGRGMTLTFSMSRFDKLKAKLGRKKGIYSPGGLAAKIGREKYGKKKMIMMSIAGRHHN